MNELDDKAVACLREAVTAPDLSNTRYRILAIAGRGGMGTVYVAEDSLLSRRVALKVLDGLETLTTKPPAEAQVLAGLEHPGIVPVHDAGTLPDGRSWYAMKLVDGARLDRAIQMERAPGERLRIFLQLCETVAFAHARGVVHRDLKPQNVMIGSFGEVLVLDWGLARRLGEATTPARAGTPGYTAPDAQGDELDDIFALGAILQGLLPGPPAIQAIARKCMSPRDERYASATLLARDVQAFLDGAAVSAVPEGPLQKIARVLSRHRIALGVLAAYVAGRALIYFFTGR